MTVFLFVIFGALALVGALGVVLARNTVHSALLLVMTLIAVAVFFLMQDAQLVAALQIIVYASAIVVLFLFVIMLLGVDRSETFAEPLRFQRPFALVLGAILLLQVLALAGHTWATGAECVEASCAPSVDGGGNVEAVARAIFTNYVWPFEITAALLVIAVVGAVVIARPGGAVEGGDKDPTETLESPPVEESGP
jgi:NADH-quinone oxidoreductase subunit J